MKNTISKDILSFKKKVKKVINDTIDAILGIKLTLPDLTLYQTHAAFFSLRSNS
ncbi:hypothetical protein ACHRVZ_15530 [Flavobacterium sp. FlaQc-57]|uniref:hypothetical protein n=1 Tax=Flavobacterium sp. FlaQc-57 TaxID=3374186 RepID=UPI0037580674